MFYQLGSMKRTESQNHLVEVIEELSEEYWENLMKQEKIISEHENNIELYNLIKINSAELTKFFDKTKEEKFTKISNDPLFEMNRLFLNYLSICQIYIDHTRHQISQRYGKESKQFEEFDEMESKNYDNYFEYRFLIRLRNFSQHVGLPITIFTNCIDDGMKFYFDREHLLKGESWSKVRKELENFPDSFEFKKQQILQMTANMGTLYLQFLLSYSEDLIKAAQELSGLVEKADGYQPIVITAKSKDAYLNNEYNLHKIPVSDAQNALNNLIQHPGIDFK